MKFIKATTFRRKVKCDYPDPNNVDGTIPFEFIAEFRYLTREQLAERVKAEKSR